MEIVFSKVSDQQHAVTVRRADGSEESEVFNSRSFLRHDLAHLAVEIEIPLPSGYWGLVAAGAPLASSDSDAGEFQGGDMATAEALAGPVQTLMRIKADTEQFRNALARVNPDWDTDDLATRIRERGRRLQGHWQATPYGGEMVLQWYLDDEDQSRRRR